MLPEIYNNNKIKKIKIKFFEDKIKSVNTVDLIKHLRLKKEDFLQSNFPYIRCSNKTNNFIVNKYKEANNLLVGLSWTSANKLMSDHKSLTLESLSPILQMKNIKFISLEFKKNSNETDE